MTTESQALGLKENPDVDDVVRAVVAWHFRPETGSPFWLGQARDWDFDPIAEILSRQDLTRLPDVSAELTRVPVRDLVPRGCGGEELRVFESGGTLGTPKRIIELGSRARSLSWVDGALSEHGAAADGGDWLHIGPSGPHIVGRSVGMLAAKRGSTCFYVDFDPRWVRRMIAEGQDAVAKQYVGHVIDQAALILESQQVSVVFATPPVIEAACARPKVEQLLRKRVSTLLWSGTSISNESLRVLEEDLFPDAKVVGIYGNSLMGIAPQRPRAAGDVHRCVFEPFYPFAVVDVVDPAEPHEPVPFGQTGRVRVSLLTRDMFLPNVLERDTAVRVAPRPGYRGDGLAQVRPFAAAAATSRIIEGVY